MESSIFLRYSSLLSFAMSSYFCFSSSARPGEGTLDVGTWSSSNRNGNCKGSVGQGYVCTWQIMWYCQQKPFATHCSQTRQKASEDLRQLSIQCQALNRQKIWKNECEVGSDLYVKAEMHPNTSLQLRKLWSIFTTLLASEYCCRIRWPKNSRVLNE